MVEAADVREDGGAPLGVVAAVAGGVGRIGVGQPDPEGVLQIAVVGVLAQRPEGALLGLGVRA